MLVRVKTLKQLFQRDRRPGNLFFATLFLVLSVFLVSQLGSQVQWQSGGKFVSQPAFWPTVSLLGMTLFAVLNWASAAVSPKIPGRWQEVAFWLRSAEYVAWFMLYVICVPIVGYLPTTIVFSVVLAFRVGFRSARMAAISAAMAISVVVVFKTFLQVKVPGGQVYEHLPDSIRSLMLTYF
ncbi:MAG: tripartite tricarboxylate transporter TctB family protein [Pseudomonadota bacterium]